MMLNKLLKLAKKQQRKHCSAVIVAAGQSSRMKGEDKILSLLQGKPVIAHSIEAFESCNKVDEIVVVTRQDLLEHVRNLCRENGYEKVKAVVEGGATRVESVMKGLDHVSEKTGLAAIHDGARPLVSNSVIEAAIEKAWNCHAAAPAIPVKDTIKSAENHMVLHTPDRKSLFAVQTPQIFDFDLLRGALQNALDHNLPITDDCSAVEALGMRVFLTQGCEENIKITTPMDLVMANAILERRLAQ